MIKEPEASVPPVEEGGAGGSRRKAKFEVYGEEMIEKEVKQSGNSGRVYLPPEWVGKNVKIIRID
jgi:putative transposon-encoded protein